MTNCFSPYGPHSPPQPLLQLWIVSDRVGGDDDPSTHGTLPIRREWLDVRRLQSLPVLSGRTLHEEPVLPDNGEGGLPGEESASTEDVLLSHGPRAHAQQHVAHPLRQPSVVAHPHAGSAQETRRAQRAPAPHAGASISHAGPEEHRVREERQQPTPHVAEVWIHREGDDASSPDT